ncbi:hypothetical protein CYMTET_31101 [Cymbomonas tetramitiformis]|uniref:Glycerate kinase n=1 Tax=Cymbomonas tetramitiformis TaxID=36881 RepID=A0AAE0FHP6_9CHLO|nr:hypothetical protein CYMTET_31101 [Cymbomonas tetramitiformis]
MCGAFSTDEDLQGFICESPLLSKVGLAPEAVSKNLDWWKELGTLLINNLQMDSENLTDAERERVYQYYLPVYHWCQSQLQRHKEQNAGTCQPIVLGLSAPQGCGKTTVVEQLEALFRAQGMTAVAVSVDDFYLTFEEQQALAEAHPGNALLQFRGNAGSHDVALGTDTLRSLLALKTPEDEAATPRYDKSLNEGRGDRAPPIQWPVVKGPVDVILFEGWMFGFAPVSEEEACTVDPQLKEVNAALRGYKAAWDSFVDAWMVIKVDDHNWVQKWRLQAEVAMREKGLPCMTDEQVKDFVDRFLPAYRAYLPGLYADGPTTAGEDVPVLVIDVDENRSVHGHSD